MHPPQGLSTAVTMQNAPAVPSNFPPTDVPSGRRCGSTKSGTIVAVTVQSVATRYKLTRKLVSGGIIKRIGRRYEGRNHDSDRIELKIS